MAAQYRHSTGYRQCAREPHEALHFATRYNKLNGAELRHPPSTSEAHAEQISSHVWRGEFFNAVFALIVLKLIFNGIVFKPERNMRSRLDGKRLMTRYSSRLTEQHWVGISVTEYLSAK